LTPPKKKKNVLKIMAIGDMSFTCILSVDHNNFSKIC
jgi:hypothetical protein